MQVYCIKNVRIEKKDSTIKTNIEEKLLRGREISANIYKIPQNYCVCAVIFNTL